jgi:hypothetical protein
MSLIDGSSHRTAVFWPSVDVFFNGGKEPMTDLDIVALREGKLLIGEVKSSPLSFKQSDFDHLERIARTVHADEVLLAAESGSAEQWAAVHASGAALAAKLKGIGTEVLTLALDWNRGTRPEAVKAQ